MTCCVLLFEATSASPLFAQVTPAWLTRVAAAVTTQLVRDVMPLYGGNLGVRVGASSTDIATGEMVFAIVDMLPDAPNAIAYHSVTGQEVPFGFLALAQCNTLDDVSKAISHEACETLGDVGVNLWADDYQGKEWARELCDAVEGNSYHVDLGDGQPPVMVSDFLYPSFFATGGQAPYCYCQDKGLDASYPAAAFATASGGYQVYRQATGAITSVWGELRTKGRHWSSRPYQRGARAAAT